MARPKKNPDDARSEWIPRVRLFKWELDKLEERCKRSGLSMSEYIRFKLFGFDDDEPLSKEEREELEQEMGEDWSF